MAAIGTPLKILRGYEGEVSRIEGVKLKSRRPNNGYLRRAMGSY
jgi:hypothetical protein